MAYTVFTTSFFPVSRLTGRRATSNLFVRGDRVVFRKMKFSTNPSPQAICVHPVAKGDNYSYIIEKFWVVADVLEGGMLLLKTRRGKTHLIHANDPKLRPATIWDRIRHGRKFATL
jgi:hypothetical protein